VKLACTALILLALSIGAASRPLATSVGVTDASRDTPSSGAADGVSRTEPISAAVGDTESASGGDASAAAAHAPRAASADPASDGAAAVLPGYRLSFPRDHGSHPAFRTEWWYVTGWLDGRDGPLGFQITFFRSRTNPALIGDNPSAFAPHQLIIAHAALSDPKLGHLRQEQRVARAGFGLAGAAKQDVDVWIDTWRLRHAGADFRAHMQAEEFSFDLSLTPTQAPLLQGEDGFSRKGPARTAASYYYSLPQLRVAGTVWRAGVAERLRGTAWLDHEWSSEYLDAQAAGWDWTGINFDDGSALMAFRIRARDGGTRWAGGTLRQADGHLITATPEDVTFSARRTWRSPRTAIAFPVEWNVRLGPYEWRLVPLFDDQENDTRASTGAIYWEGAVRATGGVSPGRGYLELTGYGQPLRLR